MIKKQITYDYNNVLAERTGGRAGIRVEEIESYSERTKIIHETLQTGRKKGDLPFYELPYMKDDV